MALYLLSILMYFREELNEHETFKSQNLRNEITPVITQSLILSMSNCKIIFKI